LVRKIALIHCFLYITRLEPIVERERRVCRSRREVPLKEYVCERRGDGVGYESRPIPKVNLKKKRGLRSGSRTFWVE